MRLPIITEIKTVNDFHKLIQVNPGLIILKFSAPWCGPCKKIEEQSWAWINAMPDNVQTVVLNIDECIELYGFFKKKRLLNGIPAIFAYYSDNQHYIPNECVLRADQNEVDYFFRGCFNYAKEKMEENVTK